LANNILTTQTIEALNRRHVSIEEILNETNIWLEKKYHDEINQNRLAQALQIVLDKDEVDDIILTAIFLDESADKLPDNHALKARLAKDANGQNVDEILALGITQQFSAAATVHYGMLDDTKPGIVGEINDRPDVNVYLDDIVAALMAATGMEYLELGGGNNY
jgi:phosphatidylglycerophosphatase A